MLRVPTECQGPERRRISISLDPEVLVEGLILDRLSTVPKRRQVDWLRTLLVRGFTHECRVVRALGTTVGMGPPEARSVPRSRGFGFGFMGWDRQGRSHEECTPRTAGTRAGSPNHNAPHSESNKPFAHLRKVVG